MIYDSTDLTDIFEKPSKINAFTLAEVLITLGIIGVVAAMTMPVLMNKTQDKILANQYKKALSVVNNGYKMMLAKEEVFKIDELPLMHCAAGDVACFSDIHKKIFNIVSDSTNRDLTATLPEAYKNIGRGNVDFDWDSDTDYSFITADGFVYGMLITNSNGTQLKYYFDVNGEKAPNQAGKDFHILTINQNGSVTANTPSPENFDQLADLIASCENNSGGEWNYSTASCIQNDSQITPPIRS